MSGRYRIDEEPGDLDDSIGARFWIEDLDLRRTVAGPFGTRKQASEAIDGLIAGYLMPLGEPSPVPHYDNDDPAIVWQGPTLRVRHTTDISGDVEYWCIESIPANEDEELAPLAALRLESAAVGFAKTLDAFGAPNPTLATFARILRRECGLPDA